MTLTSRFSRNLIILTLSAAILSLGQEIWFGFAPEFLRALGAGALAIGLFSSLQNFFEAIYHYPGGLFQDRWGVRWTLVGANVVAAVGYLIYLFSPNFIVVFLGLPFVTIWPAFVAPATVDLLAENVAGRTRTFGFAIQEIITRIPLVIAPMAGGVLISSLGDVEAGVRVGLGITVAAAALTVCLQSFGYQSRPARTESKGLLDIWRELDGGLKRLLLGETLVLFGEALTRALLVLYVIEIMDAPYWGFGLMLLIEAATAILIRGPLARVVEAIGYKPVLLVSFLATALFPVSIVLVQGWGWLSLCYVLAGLRSVGSPVRSTLLAELANPERSGQHIGLYESAVNLAVLPAGLIGAWLWTLRPATPFWMALWIGLIGCGVYALAGPGGRPEASSLEP
jgi:MFS family permease